ncbi:MAG: hypothetical protein GY696_40355 [Gammaproteobacteria bacterium]|nr:hypothetical protein [Gammaproteobacteria bacterium]
MGLDAMRLPCELSYVLRLQFREFPPMLLAIDRCSSHFAFSTGNLDLQWNEEFVADDSGRVVRTTCRSVPAVLPANLGPDGPYLPYR